MGDLRNVIHVRRQWRNGEAKIPLPDLNTELVPASKGLARVTFLLVLYVLVYSLVCLLDLINFKGRNRHLHRPYFRTHCQVRHIPFRPPLEIVFHPNWTSPMLTNIPNRHHIAP